MKDFTFLTPTEIIFGKDAELQTGKYCKKYGGSKVFLVYGGQSAKKSGLLDRVTKSIEDEGLTVMSMGGVVPNPLLSSAHEMIKAAISFQANMIVGIGGGSAIDQAKAVALGVANPDTDIWDFWTAKASPAKALPIVAIPTLPATGTEMSNSAVLTDDVSGSKTKRGLSHELNRCVFTAMNPALCMTLPDYQKGAGVADIFMHNAERYFTTIQGNHLTDQFAYAVFKNIMQYGPLTISEPDNYEAMSEVMLTGTYAHNGLTGLGSKGDTPRDGDWSCHQLGMAISAIYDSTHGATLSAVFGAWARYVMDADYNRFAIFGKEILGLDETDTVKCANLAIDGIEKFFVSLGMPINMTDLIGHKPTEAEIDALTNACSFNGARTIGTFKILSHDDMKEIYKMAV